MNDWLVFDVFSSSVDAGGIGRCRKWKHRKAFVSTKTEKKWRKSAEWNDFGIAEIRSVTKFSSVVESFFIWNRKFTSKRSILAFVCVCVMKMCLFFQVERNGMWNEKLRSATHTEKDQIRYTDRRHWSRKKNGQRKTFVSSRREREITECNLQLKSKERKRKENGELMVNAQRIKKEMSECYDCSISRFFSKWEKKRK